MPDESTFDFAVMYVPAEGVYAEILRLSHRKRPLFESAIESRVVPMSPLNMYGYSKHKPALPLFDSADAEKAISLLTPVDHGTPTTLPGDVGLELRSAGHILGSAFARLQVAGVRLLVSGDMGRPGHPLLLPPEPPGDADVVVVESTYGDRRHEETTDDDLAAAVRRTVARGGGPFLVPSRGGARRAMGGRARRV